MKSKAVSGGIVPALVAGFVLCLFTGCSDAGAVPAEADAPFSENILESCVRIYNRRVQYYDAEKGRWQDAGSVQELCTSDPYSLAAEKRAALEEALLSEQELSAEQEMLLAKESNSLSAGVEQAPAQVPSSSKRTGSASSGDIPPPSTPVEPSAPPAETPVQPTEPVPPPSGDGEDIEWSDDYL